MRENKIPSARDLINKRAIKAIIPKAWSSESPFQNPKCYLLMITNERHLNSNLIILIATTNKQQTSKTFSQKLKFRTPSGILFSYTDSISKTLVSSSEYGVMTASRLLALPLSPYWRWPEYTTVQMPVTSLTLHPIKILISQILNL